MTLRVTNGENLLDSSLLGWDDGSHRVWSLWEMVMKYGFVISTMASNLASFEQITNHVFEKQQDGSYLPHDVTLAEGFRKLLPSTIGVMQGLGLKSSVIYAERLVEKWDEFGLDRIIQKNMIATLLERIEDDLMGVSFFLFSPKAASRYEEPTKEWEPVITRFPETIRDIEEMNRCFALTRYAAAIFHSVSVVEHGLIALGSFIEVNDPKSGWTAVSGKLDTMINKTSYANLKPLFQEHRDFLEQVEGTVRSLKNAWRNKISHAHGRLAVLSPDFTPEISDEIIMATRAFMRRLAEELPT